MDATRTSEQIEEKVVEIIVEQLEAPREKVTREAAFFTDIPMDSIEMVELLMEFEETFDLNIPDEDGENIKTVGDAIDYIKKHG